MSEVRWIRCSEKLPCKFTPKNFAEAHASERRYIVCKKSGNVTMATWTFFCIGANKSSLIGGWGWKDKNPDNIIAWMPLPAPYKDAE